MFAYHLFNHRYMHRMSHRNVSHLVERRIGLLRRGKRLNGEAEIDGHTEDGHQCVGANDGNQCTTH